MDKLYIMAHCFNHTTEGMMVKSHLHHIVNSHGGTHYRQPWKGRLSTVANIDGIIMIQG